MKRRDVLLGGAVGAATLGASGEAAASRGQESFDPVAAQAILDRLDGRMASFQKLELPPRKEGDDEASRALDEERLRTARAAMRSFYFFGAVLDLPEHLQLHPGIQQRMQRMADESTYAAQRITALLESLTPEELRRLQKAFKDDPELGMKIGARFHDVAKEDDFGFKRRADLRLAFDDIGRRMAAQNPELLIEPYVSKVRRLEAKPQTLAEHQRELSVRLGEEAFWGYQERAVKHVMAWDAAYSNSPRNYLARVQEVYPEESSGPAEDSGGSTETAGNVVQAGLVMMGVGLLSTGVGALLLAAGSSGAGNSVLGVIGLILGVTVGPALFAIGLLVLIVGGLWYLFASL